MIHPTIDIIESPDVDCFHPVYNCVKYCFKCNDFLRTPGSRAEFTIALNPLENGYAPGSLFIIAGQEFTTAAQNSYNEINTAPAQTAAQFAVNVKESLEFNQYLFNTFTFAIIADVVIATARDIGAIANFTFDYSTVTNPPTNTDTQGTPNVYLENYRLAVEIWECPIGTALSKKVSQDSYIPAATGDFCINIGCKVAPLVESTLVHKTAVVINSNWFLDKTISKRICLRYGELYSNALQECEVDARTFVNADPIIVVNSAFQREEQIDKYNQMCANEWMTSTPDFTLMCLDSLVFLWINLIGVFESIVDPVNERVHPYYELTYSDGTVTTHIGTQFPITLPAVDSNGFFAVGVGLPTIIFFLNPAKQLLSWEARIVKQTNFNPATNVYYGSQFFKYTECCEGQLDFYFLNEYGGIDTVLMQEVQSIELAQEFSTSESFLDCDENDALESGIDIVNQSAFDIYTITSKFVNDYETRLWLRQFIMSPKKWIRTKIKGQDEVFSKVIASNTSTIYYNESDGFLFLTLQYRFNEDLNLQKN